MQCAQKRPTEKRISDRRSIGRSEEAPKSVRAAASVHAAFLANRRRPIFARESRGKEGRREEGGEVGEVSDRLLQSVPKEGMTVSSYPPNQDRHVIQKKQSHF